MDRLYSLFRAASGNGNENENGEAGSYQLPSEATLKLLLFFAFLVVFVVLALCMARFLMKSAKTLLTTLVAFTIFELLIRPYVAAISSTLLYAWNLAYEAFAKNMTPFPEQAVK